MKRILTRGTVASIVCLGLGACATYVDRTYHETDEMILDFGAIRLASGSNGTSVSGESLTLKAKPGADLCDVSVEVVHDTNGDGKPGNEGDKREGLVDLPGKFKEHRRGRYAMSVEGEVTKAYIVVKGRKCSDKKKDKKVIATFEVTRDGVRRTVPGPEGRGIALCASSTQPHFVEAKVVPGSQPVLRITAGDLRAVSSPLRSLYQLEAGLTGSPDGFCSLMSKLAKPKYKVKLRVVAAV